MMRNIYSLFFSGSIIVATLAYFATPAFAQKPPNLPGGYPNKPIRIVVGYAPGGGIDIVMRAFAQQLSKVWGNTVIVENRTGAGGAIAMDLVANAIPDGYTILSDGASAMYNKMLLGKVPYDILKVYVPVVKLTSQSYLLLVGPSLPVNSVKELIAYAKSRPEGLNYASSGAGTPSHIGMELFKFITGMTAVHVPYKGTPQALSDMISGQINMAFGLLISALPQVKNGRLNALAVTASHRSKLLPNLPTMYESGVPNFELTTEYGLYVPRGTPSAIVLALNKESTRIMNLPDMKDRLAADDVEVVRSNSPTEYRESLAQSISALSTFIKTSGFKAE